MDRRRFQDEFQAAMQAEGVRPLRQATPRSGPVQAKVPTPPSPVPPSPVPAERDALRAERDALRAERDALRSERDALRAERDALQAISDALRAERDEALGALQREQARGAALDQERRSLQRRLAQAVAPPDTAVAPPDTAVAPPAPGAAAEPGTAEAGDDPDPPTAAAPIDAAWAAFTRACARAGRHRVLIVGGSPAYHTALRERAAQGGPRLRLVDGEARRTLAQARRDEAKADLLVIWGATILPHSTSELYGRGALKPVRIPHRGIAGMLTKVAEALDLGASGPRSGAVGRLPPG
ncbi:hypothetical protein L6R53_05395 [Myxococcota bacterium]|nr:hypothetical protein [Myxococcota bacterium]